MNIILRRRIFSVVMMGACVLSVAIALLALTSILVELVVRGIGALSWAVFYLPTSPPNTDGGLFNAIVGSLMMIGVAIAIALPLGVLIATWLSEYSRRSELLRQLGMIVRFFNDILLSAPSIIIGLYVYMVFVVPQRHFSGWAGAFALALIAVPVIARTAEDVLVMIPDQLREAAVALGMPVWKVIVKVLWRAALKGIITGALLAVARISGETAPLLFTALNNQFLHFNMNKPIASLPIVIFQFAMSPYQDWQKLAWAGAFLISAGVLCLSVLARAFSADERK